MTGWLLALVLAVDSAGPSSAKMVSLPQPMPEGLRLLLEKPYLPADFDWRIFDDLWRTWEEPAHSQAERATVSQRRELAFARYGLTAVAGRNSDLPLQYTPTGNGGWAMNCFACHGGTVAGALVLGAPNSLYAMETLYQEVRAVKILRGRTFSHMDIGSLVVPLGSTVGTTNAIVFGIALGANRDANLNLRRKLFPPRLLHHDHDAPAWWQVHKKSQLYLDGFAPKDHRALMQFFLVEANGPKQYHAWEGDYRKILEWMETLRPPKYPWPIDAELARRGQSVFQKTCASCHGNYGPDGEYPQATIAIDEIGTDRARHDSIEPNMRAGYKKSWFGRNVADRVVVNSAGYVAPPLDGVWASPAYFHNGSVPTLWHVLHPEARPKIWKRTRDGYDRKKVGLEVSTYDRVPEKLAPAERRWYFDTTGFGKSAAGHNYPGRLTTLEKDAVLEYLKTL